MNGNSAHSCQEKVHLVRSFCSLRFYDWSCEVSVRSQRLLSKSKKTSLFVSTSNGFTGLGLYNTCLVNSVYVHACVHESVCVCECMCVCVHARAHSPYLEATEPADPKVPDCDFSTYSFIQLLYCLLIVYWGVFLSPFIIRHWGK